MRSCHAGRHLCRRNGNRRPPPGATLGYWPEPLEIPNEYYYENQTLQPYGSCFQIDELKNWSPDNDPDARYNGAPSPCGSAGWVPA